MKKYFIFSFILFFAVGCNIKNTVQPVSKDSVSGVEEKLKDTEKEVLDINFSILNEIYKFSGKVPSNLKLEYVKENQSINIYDPNSLNFNNLDKSQIFIRFFKANTFLTLNSVNVLEKENVEINGHRAVKYEIEKKPEIPNFSNQPLWRNKKHKLMDIAFEPFGETYFYVFSFNPEFSEAEFEKFIESLVFENDKKNMTFALPMENALKRVTKKPFGIKIDSKNSPVSPEKFSGFHNGVDFEIFEGEEDEEVVVLAICEGKLLLKKQANGYGGLAVQECVLEGQSVTVVYGHIKLASINFKVGDIIKAGDKLTILGKGFSAETDGERKHLHLGIHKGSDIDLRGYTKTEKELNDWIDYEVLSKLHFAK